MSQLPLRRSLSWIASSLIGLFSAIALAQPAASAPGSETVAPTSIGKMRLFLDVLPAPLGRVKESSGMSESSEDAAFAFGVRAAFDASLNDYLFVGFGPQALFNVKGKNSSKTNKQFDLSLRLGAHALIADNVHLYGFLSPGYSILALEGSNSAKGPSLGVALGALFSLPGTRFFVNAELGYHMTFLSLSEDGATGDLKTNYPLIALGGGVKL